MFAAFDCNQSANNGIGPAAHISPDIGFKVIKSKVVIDNGTAHRFTLIKVHQAQFFTKFCRLRDTDQSLNERKVEIMFPLEDFSLFGF